MARFSMLLPIEPFNGLIGDRRFNQLTTSFFIFLLILEVFFYFYYLPYLFGVLFLTYFFSSCVFVFNSTYLSIADSITHQSAMISAIYLQNLFSFTLVSVLSRTSFFLKPPKTFSIFRIYHS